MSFPTIRTGIVAAAVIYMFVIALLQPELRYPCMLAVLIGSTGLWRSYTRAGSQKERRVSAER